MKKLFAILVALMLCLTSAFALAETELTLIALGDTGLAIGLPADWNVMEVSEEDAAAGVAFHFTTADLSGALVINYIAFDAALTIEELYTTVSTSYPADLMEINGLPMVLFTDAEQDADAALLLSSDGTAALQFYFSPSSDEAFSELSAEIILTLQPVPAE